jgi:hypothetical protein
LTKPKLIKVYPEDWEALNTILLKRQAKEGKRLSFAEIIHDLIGERVGA